MQPLVCRFRLGRALGESALTLLMVFVGLLWSDSLASPKGTAASIIGGAVVLLFLLGWRWRSRFVVTEEGVDFRRSPGLVVRRLAWDEIEELFLLDESHFEVRGAGGHLRFAGPYEDLDAARDVCLPRLRSIREHLQAKALREGTVTFRMPRGRWMAHLAYFAAIVVLSGITSYCLATLLDRKLRTGLPFILLFFGGSWLWGLRKRASGLGTRVVLHREGILVRRLDGRDKIPWEDLDRAEWNDQNGINLVLRSRRVIVLPSSLGNIGLLEEFLHEGRRAIESESRGGAEERTITQSP